MLLGHEAQREAGCIYAPMEQIVAREARIMKRPKELDAIVETDGRVAKAGQDAEE